MTRDLTQVVKRLDTMLNKTHSGSVAAGAGDGGDSSSSSEDDRSRRRDHDRDKRGKQKPKPKKDMHSDDESSQGGRSFRRPQSVEWYEKKGKHSDTDDEDGFAYAFRGRLARLMDEKEVVEGVSRNEGRHGLSGIADLSNVRDLLTIDDYSLEGSPPDI